MNYKIEAPNDIQTSNGHHLIEVKQDDNGQKISSLLGILHIIALTIESAATIYICLFSYLHTASSTFLH